MIISASRRTDIPAFFADWFLQILQDGSVTVKNPMNPRQVRTIEINRSAVDAFVFWSKNPRPFFPVLDRLDQEGYPYYFQFTLNHYPSPIEPGVPPIADRLETLRRLADRIGPDRVVWRYDPILYAAGFGPEQHLQRFGNLAGQLAGLVGTCTFSFYTPYRKTERSMAGLGLVLPDDQEKRELVRQLLPLATAAGIGLDACCSQTDFSYLSVRAASCIDKDRLQRIVSRSLDLKKDPGQRPGCHCVRSVDIGTYRTCRHGCRYCYAGHASEQIGS